MNSPGGIADETKSKCSVPYNYPFWASNGDLRFLTSFGEIDLTEIITVEVLVHPRNFCEEQADRGVGSCSENHMGWQGMYLSVCLSVC